MGGWRRQCYAMVEEGVMTDLERAGVSDDIEEKWGCGGVGEGGMECECEVGEGEKRR